MEKSVNRQKIILPILIMSAVGLFFISRIIIDTNLSLATLMCSFIAAIGILFIRFKQNKVSKTSVVMIAVSLVAVAVILYYYSGLGSGSIG
jgi:hypothetical protein